MKIKGVNAFEQHVEKLLLLVVALVLLGVLAMQFMTQPNAVDAGPAGKVLPKDIFVPLAAQARGLDGQLVDVNPTFPEVSSVDLKTTYEAQLVEPIAETDRLAVAFGVPDQAGGVLGDLGTGTLVSMGPTGPITGLRMPELSGVFASSQWNTIDPYAVQQSPVLGRYVTKRQPYDLATVSVQTLLDGTKLREALTSAPEGSRQIPRKFWSQTGMAVMSVEVQRQRLDEGGSWVDDGKAVPMPGTIQPAWYLKPDLAAADFSEMISKANTVSERVMRPSFPATISGPTWLPPVQAAKREASYANIGQIKQLEARIASMEEDIERLRNPGSQSTRTTTSTPDPRGPGSRPGSTTTSRPDPSQNTSARDSQIQKKQEQIDAARKEIEDLRFTENPEEETGTSTSAPAYDPRGGRYSGGAARTATSGSLLDSDSVSIWTHDLAVKPGATYRYRIRVGVNNPLYGKGAQLEEGNAEHARLAKEPVSYTPWTEWSEPVLVGAKDYFFVTNGNTSGTLMGGGSPRATGEIYTMHYGYYRKALVQLSPGDPVRSDVKIPEGLVTIDPARIDRAQAVQALAEYEKSLGREDAGTTAVTSRDPGGRYNSAPGNAFPATTDPRNPGATTTSSGTGPFKFPEGMAAMDGRLTMGLDVMLLDVSEWPIKEKNARGGEASPIRVYLRGPDGHVKVVTPGSDDRAYAMVTQSDTLASGSWIEFSGAATGGAYGSSTPDPVADPNPFGPVPDGIWGP